MEYLPSCINLCKNQLILKCAHARMRYLSAFLNVSNGVELVHLYLIQFYFQIPALLHMRKHEKKAKQSEHDLVKLNVIINSAPPATHHNITYKVLGMTNKNTKQIKKHNSIINVTNICY